MARLIRPMLQHHQSYFSRSTLNYFLSSSSSSSTPLLLPLPTLTWHHHHHHHHRNIHHKSRGLRLPDNTPVPSDFQEEKTNDSGRGRNQKKREAKRAVHWGMDLASFSNPQIKRILRGASLEQDVYEAIMLVKRLGPDVREGKRRQFNFIGKLLRGVEPELMDTLIQATKDGDESTLQALVSSKTQIIGNDDEEFEETDYEEEDEGSSEYIEIATRWFDGLINKDDKITNEVYAVNSVDFDRQELRKLVRKVHSVQEQQVVINESEGEVNAATLGAKKSLTGFLRALAKQMPSE